MKLLLIEDEKRLVEALAHLMKKNGYAVDTAMDGETGFEMAVSGAYDVIVLDRMLPALDGVALLKAFRDQGFDTPVLLLTAKDAPCDRVEGLDAGADDYLVKPFNTSELLARLRALTRRQSKSLVETILTAAGLTLDPFRGEVTKDGTVIQLSVKESLLLELLMRNHRHVVTKERIFEKVWGYHTEIELANVDLYIHYLRKKLNTPYIRTARGIGYYLQEDHDVS